MKPTLAVVHAGVAQPLPRAGGFGELIPLALEAQGDDAGRFGAALGLAEQAGADWLIVLSQGEALSADALEFAAPSLGLFDAIFGAAHVAGGAEPVSRLSRLAFDQPERLPHALLNWWLPAAHLIRVDVARRTLAGLRPAGLPWRLAWLFALWRDARCQKSAQPLLVLDREPQPLDTGEREAVLRELERAPVFLPIVHGDLTYHLPYTGRNAGIEREQSRGLFFEASELEELRKLIAPGARIVDVGANTGNHTVFFAGPMRAARVIPIEPLPGAIAALTAAVARNALQAVDLSLLGVGVGAAEGKARLVLSHGGGLGATSLKADPQGEIRIATLDALIEGPADFLKIDVEGMEMEVLAGAAGLIARQRPAIFIEIANRNTAAFSGWLEANAYRVARVFTDKGHANYLIEPLAGRARTSP